MLSIFIGVLVKNCEPLTCIMVGACQITGMSYYGPQFISLAAKTNISMPVEILCHSHRSEDTNLVSCALANSFPLVEIPTEGSGPLCPDT